MSERYFLIKDTPELRKGAIVEFHFSDKKYRVIDSSWDTQSDQAGNTWYTKQTVENNPEWFSPEGLSGTVVEVKIKNKTYQAIIQ